jgi:hypothetical protein
MKPVPDQHSDCIARPVDPHDAVFVFRVGYDVSRHPFPCPDFSQLVSAASILEKNG